jgi:hypothetical protein
MARTAPPYGDDKTSCATRRRALRTGVEHCTSRPSFGDSLRGRFRPGAVDRFPSSLGPITARVGASRRHALFQAGVNPVFWLVTRNQKASLCRGRPFNSFCSHVSMAKGELASSERPLGEDDDGTDHKGKGQPDLLTLEETTWREFYFRYSQP